MNLPQDRYLQLMEEFGRRIGDDLTPSEHGVTSLVAEGVAISLERPHRSDFIYFHAPIGRLGANPAGELATAMQRNLFGMPVSGSWLAHDAETNELVLCFSANIGKTTVDDLVAAIDAMAAAVKELEANFRALDASPVNADTDDNLSTLSFSVFRV